MPLTAEQLDTIRRSFGRIRRDFEPASTFFYEELFRRAPELRALFRDDLAGQGMKFMSTLATIVDGMHDPDALDERYAELGRLHGSLGVTAPMFEPMGEALIATVKHTLGNDFTPEVAEAWRTAYEDMVQALIAKGGIPAT